MSEPRRSGAQPPSDPAGPSGQPGPSVAGAWPAPRSRHGGIDEIPLPGSPGRLWLCGKHFIGPDPDLAVDHVSATKVVCLNQEHELSDRYPGYVEWLRTHGDGRAIWFPVHDLHAPPLEATIALLERIHALLQDGEVLLVHCGAGIGRAGTIAAGTLLAMGESREQALATVAANRPMAGPETGAQQALISALASHYAERARDLDTR